MQKTKDFRELELFGQQFPFPDFCVLKDCGNCSTAKKWRIAALAGWKMHDLVVYCQLVAANQWNSKSEFADENGIREGQKCLKK